MGIGGFSNTDMTFYFCVHTTEIRLQVATTAGGKETVMLFKPNTVIFNLAGSINKTCTRNKRKEPDTSEIYQRMKEIAHSIQYASFGKVNIY